MSEIYVGIMSGTSLDGIDVSIVDFSKNKVTTLYSQRYPFASLLQLQLMRLITDPHISLEEFCELQNQLAKDYAIATINALKAAKLKPSEIKAIGCHGQTVYHLPDEDARYSLQMGSGAILAEETNIPVVTDFRNNDMALGGQGAPLVCGFHVSLVPKKTNTVFINLGGIANVTIISKDVITGFDTGPANCLLDAWYKEWQQGEYDVNGDWADSGEVNDELLKLMLTDQYFAKLPPKSTGKEYFNQHWVEQQLQKFKYQISPEHVQRTLIELTTVTISDALKKLTPDSIYICGGGVHNETLINSLAKKLSAEIKSTKELGIDPDFMEAIAFAWLAKKRLNEQTAVISSVTGAKVDAIAGCVYLPSR